MYNNAIINGIAKRVCKIKHDEIIRTKNGTIEITKKAQDQILKLDKLNSISRDDYLKAKQMVKEYRKMRTSKMIKIYLELVLFTICMYQSARNIYRLVKDF